MYRYVKVDSNGYAEQEFWCPEVRKDTDLIEVGGDFNLTNQRWNGTEWIDENVPDYSIDEQEQAQLEMQSNVEYLVALAEMNMEV